MQEIHTPAPVDSADMLFMVDNSNSMKDNQHALGQQFNLLLDQFVLQLGAVNPVYRPILEFAKVLNRDWTVDRKTGSYVILRRRR